MHIGFGRWRRVVLQKRRERLGVEYPVAAMLVRNAPTQPHAEPPLFALDGGNGQGDTSIGLEGRAGISRPQKVPVNGIFLHNRLKIFLK